MARLWIPFVVLALVAAACGSDSEGEASGTSAAEATSTGPPASLHPGVTDDTIKVGVVALDWEALADLGVDLGRGNSIDLYEAALETINDDGGVHGRTVELYPEVVFPVGSADTDAACVEHTEDIEVFVTMGAFLGDDVLCYSELHESATLGAGSRSEERIARARAPYVTVLGSQADRARNFVEIMEEQGVLEGKTIGVSGSVDVDEATYHSVFDALVEAGYDPVPGLAGGNEEDLVETANEQEIIYERFDAEGVDLTISTTGVPLSMANAIEAGYESDQWVFYVIMSPHGLADAGVPWDYLEGAVGVVQSVVGTSAQPALAEDPLARECFERLDADTGRELSLALDGEPTDLSSYIFACIAADILERGLENAGPDLNYETFEAGLEAIGDFPVLGGRTANLSPGHMGAVDTLRYVEFDHVEGVWNLEEEG